MKTYVIANQKGGVGKTTTATALASILRSSGYRTLLIDADQQGNSTDTFRGEIEGCATLYDVLLSDTPVSLAEAIQHMDAGDLIASDPLLNGGDKILSQKPIGGLFRLQKAMRSLDGLYDYVIIDTAPTINYLLYNTLLAADEVIIPVTADRYGLQGLSQLNEVIGEIREQSSIPLKIAGLLLVKYNPRTKLGREAAASLEAVAEMLDTKLYKTTIRESTRAREAQAKRIPLIDYDPKCTTAQDYMSFAAELLEEEEVTADGKE